MKKKELFWCGLATAGLVVGTVSYHYFYGSTPPIKNQLNLLKDLHGMNSDEVRTQIGEPNRILIPPQLSPTSNKEVWEYDAIDSLLERKPFLVYFNQKGIVHRISTDEHN